MIHSDLDQARDLFSRPDLPREELIQAFVDVTAIAQHAIDGRTCQQATLGARMTRTLALIVRVETIVETLVIDPITRQVGHEEERLEEPRAVRQVPFGR